MESFINLFWDSFEVAVKRDKLTENIPFRLTSMIIKALEIWGIEGTFIFTWENVMRLIRENRESLKAILMAFVYDTIINWKKIKILMIVIKIKKMMIQM